MLFTRVYPEELRTKLDPLVYKRIADLYDKVYTLDAALSAPAPGTLTTVQVATIRAALEARGQYPLNVQGLLGVLSQPQVAGAPSFTTFPPSSDPKSQDGALGVLGSLPSVLYRFSKATLTWVAISAAALLAVLHNAVAVGTRGTINLIDGTGITLTVVDNGGSQRVDITIAVKAQSSVAAWTGTADRTTHDTGTATLTNVLQAFKALVDDLRSGGFIS